MKRLCNGISLYLLLYNGIYGQSSDEITVLIHQIPNTKNDTLKIRLYKKISEAYILKNLSASRTYADKGLLLAEKMKWLKGISVFKSQIGRLFNESGQYDSSIIYYKNALIGFEKNKDERNQASTIINMGVTYMRLSRYKDAFNCYYKSLKISEGLKDSSLIATNLENISSIHSIEKNFTKAITLREQAIQIRKALHDSDNVTRNKAAVAGVYLNMKQYDKAKLILESVKRTYERDQNKLELADVLSNLSIAYENDYTLKIQCALKSKILWDEISPNNDLALSNLGNLGVAYLDIIRNDAIATFNFKSHHQFSKTQLLEKSISYLQAAITKLKMINDIDNTNYFTGCLAEAQALQGDYKNAYENFRRYQDNQDSLYSQTYKNEIAQIESKYILEKKNTELAISQLTLSTQKKQSLALIIGIVLLSIIGGLLFVQNRWRKINNKKLKAINIELQHANQIKAKFFGILSHDMRLPLSNIITLLDLQNSNPGILSASQITENETKIYSASQTLLKNLDETLLWSKGQMEHFQPDIAEVLIEEVFKNLSETFKTMQNVQLKFVLEENVILNTDRQYLLVIMQNLTANAYKALENTAYAEVEWKAVQKKQTIVLSISDNGLGITEENWNNRMETTTIKKGLGLHIIKDLAKAIHCSIHFSTTQKIGTCITLSFEA